MTATLLLEKNNLRKHLKELRRNISLTRRFQVAFSSLKTFQERFPAPTQVLSYASFSDEFDTTLINNLLGEEKRLLLPRISENGFQIYRVTELANQLKRNRCGILEPDPAQCREVSYCDIELILVPGLGFDKKNHRIGYGKGYYDRFLKEIPSIPSYGLGFIEQLQEKDLPCELHDYPLTEILLF